MNLFMTYLLFMSITIVLIVGGVYLASLFSGNRRVVHDIIENVNELIFIYNKEDQPCFTKLPREKDDVQFFLHLIESKITQAGVIPKDYQTLCDSDENPIIYEGEVAAGDAEETWFSWKMSAVIREGKYLGRILVLNDITQYRQLMTKLDRTNKKLGNALEEQRSYVEDEKQLETVRESERIMQLVNSVSKQYLEQLDESIRIMADYAQGQHPEAHKRFDAENEQMIAITRETISKIRSTVQTLHSADR